MLHPVFVSWIPTLKAYQISSWLLEEKKMSATHFDG